jgi:hypothetical protein
VRFFKAATLSFFVCFEGGHGGFVTVTKEVGQGQTSMSFPVDIPSYIDRGAEVYLKKLIGRKDVEEVLQQLDQLTQEECQMAAAEALVITHSVDNKVMAMDDKVRDMVNKVKDMSNMVRGMYYIVKDVDEKVEDLDERVQGVNKQPESFGHNKARSSCILYMASHSETYQKSTSRVPFGTRRQHQQGTTHNQVRQKNRDSVIGFPSNLTRNTCSG